MVYEQYHGLTNCDIVTECITIQQWKVMNHQYMQNEYILKQY